MGHLIACYMSNIRIGRSLGCGDRHVTRSSHVVEEEEANVYVLTPQREYHQDTSYGLPLAGLALLHANSFPFIDDVSSLSHVIDAISRGDVISCVACHVWYTCNPLLFGGSSSSKHDFI